MLQTGGTLDVKLSTLIGRILLKHAVKMDSVVEFNSHILNHSLHDYENDNNKGIFNHSFIHATV
jgi:hypothetical protein